MSDQSVFTPSLSGLRLPEEATARREMPLSTDKRSETYVANFDHHTLVYDALRTPERISLFCPRLLNLWPLLRDGLRLDGRPVKLRRHKSLRFERLDLPRGASGDLTVTIEGQMLPLVQHDAEPERFAGRNVLIAMVKDTPADWIIDWVNYHMSAHGADGLVLLDNGSERHFRDDLQNRLLPETGLAAVALVSSPFPYGANAGGRFLTPAKFLQVAMLNLMRARFLGKARAILSVDVDEFVQPIAQTNVFDLARQSRLGCVSFTGVWAFAPEATGPTLQAEHTHTDPDSICKNPKWCLVPGRIADRFALAVHRPAGPLFPLTHNEEIKYWHFRATTTGWKSMRYQTGGSGQADDVLRETLSAHF
ncbi:hypothetical protein [Yoonia sp.]|uniref:hypothetical protein n=1 Tax=Yoonia sp. TaxID=2212373 RepID=UPI0035C879FB